MFAKMQQMTVPLDLTAAKKMVVFLKEFSLAKILHKVLKVSYLPFYMSEIFLQ